MEDLEQGAEVDDSELIRCTGILADGSRCTRTRHKSEGEGDRCALHAYDSEDESDDEAELLGGDGSERRRRRHEDPVERVHRQRHVTAVCSCLCLIIGIIILVTGIENHKIVLFALGIILVCCPSTALCFVGLEWFCEFYGVACMERLFIIFSTIHHHQEQGDLMNFQQV